MNLNTVRVRLKDDYLPALHTREIEMYEGPARQLEQAGRVEIIAEKKPDKLAKARKRK